MSKAEKTSEKPPGEDGGFGSKEVKEVAAASSKQTREAPRRTAGRRKHRRA